MIKKKKSLKPWIIKKGSDSPLFHYECNELSLRRFRVDLCQVKGAEAPFAGQDPGRSSADILADAQHPAAPSSDNGVRGFKIPAAEKKIRTYYSTGMI